VRTTGDAASLASAVRTAIRSVDPGLAIDQVATMDQLVATSSAQRRLALELFGGFAIVALLLAGAGIYGVLANSVAERTREIGVRTALGATPMAIARIIVTHGAKLTVPGLVLGLLGALALGRYLRSLLFAIQPTDPLTLVGVATLLAVVAAIACLLPALRAVRVDPMDALRGD
jgi:putative ABC transport system permease protein